jgi:hypothetical protein
MSEKSKDTGGSEMKTIFHYAHSLGYKITRQKGSVNISTKTIFMDFNEYDITKQGYLLSHELGHVQIFRLISFLKVFNYYKVKKNHVFLRLFDEGVAWIIGFFLCIRFKVSIKGFFPYAFNCWKTYWIRR